MRSSVFEVTLTIPNTKLSSGLSDKVLIKSLTTILVTTASSSEQDDSAPTRMNARIECLMFVEMKFRIRFVLLVEVLECSRNIKDSDIENDCFS